MKGRKPTTADIIRSKQANGSHTSNGRAAPVADPPPEESHEHNGTDNTEMETGPTECETASGSTQGEMVQILVDPHESLVADAVRKVLATDEALFQRNGKLVQIVRADAAESPSQASESKGRKRSIETTWPADSPRIQDAAYAFVRERISATCYLYEMKKIGKKTRAVHRLVPTYLPAAILANPKGIRRLRGLLPGPTLDADGRLINTAGYDAPTLCYLADDLPGLTPPEHPTRADAIAAAGILGDLVIDFPFLEEADRSRWLCLLLASVCRHLLQETPLGLITANKAGAGKSRLAELISIISHGKGRPILMSWPEGDGQHQGQGNEIRKRLCSLLHGGASLALIDNLPRGQGFGSSEIDAFLTADTYQDRKLSFNDGSFVGGANRCLLLATGNAIHPVGDTSDRTLRVELLTPEAAPRSRPPETFKIPELIAHTKAHRAKYLGAAMTIWRAWIQAGAPKTPGETWGSFEDFAGKVVAMIRWIGWPDPIANRACRAAEMDPEGQDLGALLAAWYCELGTLWHSAGELLAAVDRTSTPGSSPTANAIAFRDALLGLGGWQKPPTVKRLGVKLASWAMCPIDVDDDGNTIRLRLVLKKDPHNKTNTYRVEEVSCS